MIILKTPMFKDHNVIPVIFGTDTNMWVMGITNVINLGTGKGDWYVWHKPMGVDRDTIWRTKDLP